MRAVKSLLKRFALLIDALTERLKSVLIWVILFTVFISAGNALVRKLTGESSNAWLELQWYGFSAVFLLGAGYVLKKDEHVRIDILYSALSAKTRRGLNGMTHLFLTLPMLIGLFILSFSFWLRSFLSEAQIAEMAGVIDSLYIIVQGLADPSGWERSPNAGGLSLWYAKGLLPLGLLFLILQTLSEILKDLNAAVKS